MLGVVLDRRLTFDKHASASGAIVQLQGNQVTVLIGLDLFAASDTVCHETLLQRLQAEFGVTGTALSWIQSYLEGRTQFVKLDSTSCRK